MEQRPNDEPSTSTIVVDNGCKHVLQIAMKRQVPIHTTSCGSFLIPVTNRQFNLSYNELLERRRLLYSSRSLSVMFSDQHPQVEEVNSLEKYKEKLMNFSSELALQIAFVQSLEPLRDLSLDDKVGEAQTSHSAAFCT